MIKAVIFDMDGVISDTENLHSGIESEILNGYGIKTNPSEIADKYAGVPTHVFFKEIFDANNVSVDIDEIVGEKQKLMLKKSKGNIKPMLGVLELIRKVQEKELKFALGTSSQRKLANLILDELHLIDAFEVIVSIEDVKNGKPNPDIFLLAAERLEVTPEECIVIEDGRSGMLAAKRAGMRCIGLVKDRNSKDYPADLLVESLEEINIDNISN